MIVYIIKSILCMGMSLLLYHILLRPGKNFIFNRFYLLVSLLLTVSVPALNLSSTHSVPLINEINFTRNNESNYQTNNIVEEENIEVGYRPHIPLKHILVMVYVIVALFFMLRFIVNLLQIINSTNEKDINLSISTKLAALSEKNNVKIVLIRSDDKFISRENRAKFVNELKPDLLLSIHCNYAKNNSLHGMDAFYSNKGKYSMKSYDFCETILSGNIENITDEDQIKNADFYILENADCPGVLLQLGFLSNEYDFTKLSDNNYHNQIAKSIYTSLVKICSN